MEKDNKGQLPEEDKVTQAVSYAVGSNGLEGLRFTEDELKQIHAEVLAGKGEKSFLMAVLEYVQNKREQQKLLTDGGVNYGPHRK